MTAGLPAETLVDTRDTPALAINCPTPGGMVYSCRLSNGLTPLAPGGHRLTTIVVESDESFESALKRFKKQCEKAGLSPEIRKRQHDAKPSARRKRKALAARTKAKRRERNSD